MKEMYTVSEAAVKVGISKEYIYKWIDQYKLRYKRKSNQMYIDEQTVLELIKIHSRENGASTYISMEVIDDKLSKLLNRLNDMEIQLSQKADEVVFSQLLQQRSDLEKLENKVQELEEKLKQQEVTKGNVTQLPIKENSQENVVAFSKPKKRRILSVFGI